MPCASDTSTEEVADMAGSNHDAILIVELSKWGAMIGLPDAARTIFADDFDPEAAELDDSAVQKVLTFGETLATLVKNDLLDRELVYDWVWVAGIWTRVGPAAKRARAQMGFSALYENLEALAAGQADAI
jgi:hypothetical protein